MVQPIESEKTIVLLYCFIRERHSYFFLFQSSQRQTHRTLGGAQGQLQCSMPGVSQGLSVLLKGTKAANCSLVLKLAALQLWVSLSYCLARDSNLWDNIIVYAWVNGSYKTAVLETTTSEGVCLFLRDQSSHILNRNVFMNQSGNVILLFRKQVCHTFAFYCLIKCSQRKIKSP